MATAPRHLRNWLAVAFILLIAQFADLFPVDSTLLTYLYAFNAVIDYAIYFSICAVSSKFRCIRQPYIIALLTCQALMLITHALACIGHYSYTLHQAEWLALINDQYCFVLRVILFAELLIILGAGDGLRIRYKHNRYGARVFNPAIVRSDNFISDQDCHNKKTRYGYF